jgi:hypothetical protein
MGFRQTFAPGPTMALAVGDASTRAALPVGGVNCRITNLGDRPLWVEFGDAAVVAAQANSLAVLPMAVSMMRMPTGATHVAVISPGKDPISVNITFGEGS